MNREIWDIEAFYTGTHTDAYGKTLTWTKEDLEQAIKNYRQRLDSGDKAVLSPAVLGHPTTNAPRFGDITNAYIRYNSSGDKKGTYSLWLTVEPTDTLTEWIKKGYYRERSLSMRRNEKGEWEINHIGFLGAADPALNKLSHDGLPIDVASITKPATFVQSDNSLYYVIREAEFSFSRSVVHKSNFALEDMNEEQVKALMQEELKPILAALDEMRKMLEANSDKPSEPDTTNPDAPANMNDKPEEGKNPSFSKTDLEIQALKDQVNKLVSANGELALNAHVANFEKWLDTPDVASRMTKNIRDMIVTQFKNTVRTADFSKGEPAGVEELKKAVLDLPVQIDFTRNSLDSRGGLSSYTNPASGQRDAKAIADRILNA